MMTKMKKLTLGLSAAALAIGGTAYAQASGQPAQERARAERPTMDANGDGTISRAEAQAAATAMFAKADVNRDGKLDQSDRALARQKMRESMFAKLDTNADGSISKAEFTAQKSPADRGTRMGRKDGRSRDGHGGRGHRGHRGFGGAHGGMAGADADKDGAISQAEFMAAATARFDAQDTNRDGNVTKEERQAAREANRAKRQAQWEARKADNKADTKAVN